MNTVSPVQGLHADKQGFLLLCAAMTFAVLLRMLQTCLLPRILYISALWQMWLGLLCVAELSGTLALLLFMSCQRAYHTLRKFPA